MTEPVVPVAPAGPQVPVELSFLQHGESEGERARREAPDAVPAEFWQRPPHHWRLTAHGAGQARQAGAWLRGPGAGVLGRRGSMGYAVSPMLRAVETAALLELPGADWRIETALADRSWGPVVAAMTPADRELWTVEAGRQAQADQWYWAPPAGESLAAVQARVRSFLTDGTVPGQRRLFVTHGEVIHAVRGVFEGAVQQWAPLDATGTCLILAYSRRDPDSGLVGPRFAWVRLIDPLSGSTGRWQPIGGLLPTAALWSIVDGQPSPLW